MLDNQVHDLFSLDKDEKIIEEFDCFLFETLPIKGQLYITDNHLCFYSNLLFFNRNITIPLNEITKLNLNIPNIEIETKNDKNLSQNYKFFDNEKIQNIHDKIKSSLSLLKSDSNENDDVSLMSKKTSASSELSSNEDLICEFEEINFLEKTEDDFEVCKKIINISPKDFFNKYFTSTFPETSFEKYYEWVGDHSNIKISDWEKIENNENSEIEKFKKTENFSLSLHNVPMIDHSDVSKTSIYYVDKNGVYHINNSSTSEGVPFSDSFTIEAKIELYPYINGTKTVFRTYVRTNFLKSCFLKGLLVSQTKKSYEEEINKWLGFIQEKGEKILGDYVCKEKIYDNNQNDNKGKDNMNQDKNNKESKVNIYKLYESLRNNCDKKTIGIIVLFLAIIISYFLYLKK